MAACATSCSRSPTIVVGSKNFTEQIVIGELAAQQLEHVLGQRVERKLDLGGTLLAHQALVKGEIDLYPEYTGTAMASVLREQGVEGSKVFKRLSDEYERRFQVAWLPSLGFEDTFAMVVLRREAEKLSSKNLSSANRRAWRLGMGYEFLTRQDGYRGLSKAYKLRWQGAPKTMDLGLLYRALQQGQIDMAAANSTDGLLLNEEFQVLADDRHAFPPYEACYVVRQDTFARFPKARAALDQLSGKVSADVMRRLNWQVDHEHRPVVRLVTNFLQQQIWHK